MKNVTHLINIPLPRLLTNILEKAGTKTYYVVEVKERKGWQGHPPDSWEEYHETEELAFNSVAYNANEGVFAGPLAVTKLYLGKQTFKLQASWVKV